MACLWFYSASKSMSIWCLKKIEKIFTVQVVSLTITINEKLNNTAFYCNSLCEI